MTWNSSLTTRMASSDATGAGWCTAALPSRRMMSILVRIAARRAAPCVGSAILAARSWLIGQPQRVVGLVEPVRRQFQRPARIEAGRPRISHARAARPALPRRAAQATRAAGTRSCSLDIPSLKARN